MSQVEWVWLYDEQAYGVVLKYGATHSLIRYESVGHIWEEWIENDDFEFRSERAIEYEQDDQ